MTSNLDAQTQSASAICIARQPLEAVPDPAPVSPIFAFTAMIVRVELDILLQLFLLSLHCLFVHFFLPSKSLHAGCVPLVNFFTTLQYPLP
jgi:hypothetical protein